MTEARAGEPVDRHLPAPRPVTGPADRASFTYSIVVPVFNSEGVVGRTVDRIIGGVRGRRARPTS